MSIVVGRSQAISVIHQGRPGSAYVEVILYAPGDSIPQGVGGLAQAASLKQNKGFLQRDGWRIPHFFDKGGEVTLPAAVLAGVSDESIVEFRWHYSPNA